MSALRASLRPNAPRQAILRRHLAVGAKKINVGKSVGSFVPKLAQKAFEKYGFSTVALLTDWAVIAGTDLAGFTRPEKLKWPRTVSASGDVEAGCEGRPGATLILRVEPARALDVEYGAGRIVERINSYFGYRAVSDMKILQMPLDAGARSARRRQGVAGSASGGDGPSTAERSVIGVDLVAGVTDEKLRESLQRLQAGILRPQQS
ncbi:MAG: hypothetical protein APF80_16315 [Alphaproteobacteria bacterium BRH_c36]|nr:MAG: hypothetical protein APF80_16315 [Alphaproteobacteria bacterium BRH_c36]